MKKKIDPCENHTLKDLAKVANKCFHKQEEAPPLIPRTNSLQATLEKWPCTND